MPKYTDEPTGRQCKMEYDPISNILYIHAEKEDFVPKYLDYLLEHLGIQKNVKRVFLGWPLKDPPDIIE